MKILKNTDRVSVKIDTVTLKLSPLTFQQKSEVQGFMMEATKGNTQAGLEGARLAVKYSVKDMLGVTDIDGEKYNLELGEDGCLTDECCADLTNSEMSEKLMITCCSIMTGMKQEIMDPITKKKLEGVTVLKNSKRVKKKK